MTDKAPSIVGATQALTNAGLGDHDSRDLLLAAKFAAGQPSFDCRVSLGF